MTSRLPRAKDQTLCRAGVTGGLNMEGHTASIGTEPGLPKLPHPDQAAELLSVKTSWVYEAVRTKKLPCRRVGRRIRFTRAMLEEWLDSR